MSEKHLHIISFDIPYPPNYGGVIDVFFKIKTLKEAGVKIHLHCFEYPGRERADELKQYCESVDYYPRKTGITPALSLKPYIVSGRKSDELFDKLMQDDYPILFEGLHSCYYIDDPGLKDRFKIYRESNIEHRYYFNLFKVEHRAYNKFYFFIESLKLRIYQNKLKHADLMLAVSQKDTEYLQSKFPHHQVKHLPSFHANTRLDIKKGRGEYALYHGNIEVPENAFAAKYLINKVFSRLDFPLIIAGMNPPEEISRLADRHDHIKMIPNPSDEEMFELIRNAHINVLVTFQATGLKLKLLNTLYNGRFCVVNDKMLSGTPLGGVCDVANNENELREKIGQLAKAEFGEELISDRNFKLNGLYCNKINAEKLIGLIS
ncbi:MAG: glycosyltransferase family 1 protein [Bacteroidota bacterium]|nr:glycosyltransferase family 1 protein [Bacteroidota bacterium]